MLFHGSRFCINFILATLGTLAITALIDVFLKLSANTLTVMFLPLLIAGMVEGTFYARQHKSKPDTRSCCTSVIRMTGLCLAICAAFFVGPYTMVVGFDAWRAIPLESVYSVMAIAFLPICMCVLLKIGYSIGLATELKGQQFSN